MPTYDATLFDPPAPVARVTLRDPSTGTTWSDVPMLLDSGADVTLVPLACVDHLGLTPMAGRSYEVQGFDGAASLAPVVTLELGFQGRLFRGQFLLHDDDVGIIGRNVLNRLAIVFDGPRLEWREL